MHLGTRLAECIRGLMPGCQPPPFYARRRSSTASVRPGSADDLTVFVTTIGDRANFNDCMAHLKAQTVKTALDSCRAIRPGKRG